MVDKLNFTLKKKEDKRKKSIKILKLRIDGSDRIWMKLQGIDGEKQFNPETQEILLGGKVVEPMLSYAINSWNVMLPFITYAFHKEQCEAYMQSVAYKLEYEKEDI